MQITELLRRLEAGDRGAMHDVIPLVYEELKNISKGTSAARSGCSF